MAGSSSSSLSEKVCAASLSPKAKGAEKKKRKRPSKKVPTTVLESSSSNFMNLVQKLTGAAGELAASHPPPPSLPRPTPVLSHSVASTTSSPYSSPSCDYADPRTSDSFFQQLLRSATHDNDSSSPTPFPNPTPASLAHLHYPADEEFYSSYSPSSSRALENEISPFSSSWREPVACHSEFWYQPMRA